MEDLAIFWRKGQIKNGGGREQKSDKGKKGLCA